MGEALFVEYSLHHGLLQQVVLLHLRARQHALQLPHYLFCLAGYGFPFFNN